MTCRIAAAVAADIGARAAAGLRKYGVTLERTDLSRRDWLQHGYEEALDLACYLKRLIQMEDDQPTNCTTRDNACYRA